MARGRRPRIEPLKFSKKLVLNQWLLSLFGIDPLAEHRVRGRVVRQPFTVLADPLRDTRLEGLDERNLHRFYNVLVTEVLGLFPEPPLTPEQLLVYEENLVRHTQQINEKRDRPIVWKYFQWLTLLFTEVYLDRYFNDRDGLLHDLNEYVERFNRHYPTFADVPPYEFDDLNKLCLQNATGSGKTLIMHVNLLQYRHYARQAGKENDLSRVILLTTNERLSEQHLAELRQSSLDAEWYTTAGGLFRRAGGLGHVDVMEITKLADQDGPQQIATRNLGDQNLLLVDEGHRGMSSTEEGAWFTRRAMLCAKGFTFEYSATFEQAAVAAKDERIENSYAKTVVFDYSYRYFYEDGFGKDYQILNLPAGQNHAEAMYLTACLLRFYQQLRLYEDRRTEYLPFNLEKPLWVFVGSTVTGGSRTNVEREVLSDVGRVIQFLADFLHDDRSARDRLGKLLTGTGQDTGLLDENGLDIFAGSFTYLSQLAAHGLTTEVLYRDILTRVFQSPAGGALTLSRLKGDSGEVALKCGTAEAPFGLINVGDALGLCKHCEDTCTHLAVEESEFGEPMFASVRESSSPVNVLLGSKKFIEGWDCWRVSTMGLMHVGRSEGAQIIQLFGRGVRLKGWEWSLKRSAHAYPGQRPAFIEELETLNVFGVAADFMQRFKEFLEEEGLPGNEKREALTIPLNVTYDVGKKLKVLRPKRKKTDGTEFDFKRDGKVPQVGDPGLLPYLHKNPVESDWYPRIQARQSRGKQVEGQRHEGVLGDTHLALLNFDELYFELERYKRERSWHNLNVTKDGVRAVLTDGTWYRLFIPASSLAAASFQEVRLWQQVATELMKRYCERLYNYRKTEFLEPRLEYRELGNEELPDADEYTLTVDGDDETLIQQILKLKEDLETSKDALLGMGDLRACRFGRHLYQPLLHVRRGGRVKVSPVALNESEYQFVTDLINYHGKHEMAFARSGAELFLLRNLSRGKGVGFFEAGNFYPDFILWLLEAGKQYVTFIEPHGLLHGEGPSSPKVQFHRKIKEIEARLGDPDVTLNAYLLSPTAQHQLTWSWSPADFEANHVLFMADDHYLRKLMAGARHKKLKFASATAT